MVTGYDEETETFEAVWYGGSLEIVRSEKATQVKVARSEASPAHSLMAVLLVDLSCGGVGRLHRVEVCLQVEDRRAFIRRFKAAVVRRRAAESLLR